MKAAVIYKAGDIPVYAEVPEPIPGPGEVIVKMKAASVKNLDKTRAKGTHYDAYQKFPAIAGADGVGVLENGTRVYTGGEGMMAEKVAVNKNRLITLPDNIDDVTAAAIPNPGISAWLSLAWKGQLKKGDAVLILGATGITGKVAVQIAKHLGAGKIVAAGRNPKALKELKHMGADVVISLNQNEEEIKNAMRNEIMQKPFDIILDYLWGKPAEIVLDALTGKSLTSEPHLTRYIQVGETAGATINLPAAALRSSWIEISGAGGGSIPHEVLGKIGTEYLPKLFELASQGKLTISTKAISLENVEQAWQQDISERIVLTI